jgi:hypothetical protein
MLLANCCSPCSVRCIIRHCLTCCRKKHGLESKEDMEKSIGYSRCTKELPQTSDTEMGLLSSMPASSSNTICKYCGEDFKFYRTLKHHLRSQSSCAHKPFTCRSCSVGFSTKANCLRHIQKRHMPLAAGATPDSLMLVNESILAAQQNSINARPSSRCSSATNQSEIAHLQQASSENQASKKSALECSLIPAHFGNISNIKLENASSSAANDDQPLDFSLKSTSSQRLGLSSHQNGVELTDDQPMDLTTGPPRNKISNHSTSSNPAVCGVENATVVPIPLVVATKCLSSNASVQSTIAPSHLRRHVTGTPHGSTHSSSAKCWQCPYCCALFKNSFKVCALLWFFEFDFFYVFSLVCFLLCTCIAMCLRLFYTISQLFFMFLLRIFVLCIVSMSSALVPHH